MQLGKKTGSRSMLVESFHHVQKTTADDEDDDDDKLFLVTFPSSCWLIVIVIVIITVCSRDDRSMQSPCGVIRQSQGALGQELLVSRKCCIERSG